jgi:hypothetical protein
MVPKILLQIASAAMNWLWPFIRWILQSDAPIRQLAIVWTISVCIAIGRLLVPTHELSFAGSYQAIAHIWVGMLIVLGWNDRFTRWALFALVALELVMFSIR